MFIIAVVYWCNVNVRILAWLFYLKMFIFCGLADMHYLLMFMFIWNAYISFSRWECKFLSFWLLHFGILLSYNGEDAGVRADVDVYFFFKLLLYFFNKINIRANICVITMINNNNSLSWLSTRTSFVTLTRLSLDFISSFGQKNQCQHSNILTKYQNRRFN